MIMATAIGRSTDPSTATHRADVSSNKPASFRYNNPGAQYPSERAARFGQIGYGIIKGPNKINRGREGAQEVVGAKADGSVGPATIAATKAASPKEVVTRLAQCWRAASKDGSDRITEVEQKALQMTAAGGAGA
jgi:hypothetical protein